LQVKRVKAAENAPCWNRTNNPVATAGNDPLTLRKARISVNTFLRRSRSLFSQKLLRQLQLRLPSPLPFDGVEFEPRQSMKYRSDFNVINLIKLASKELIFVSAVKNQKLIFEQEKDDLMENTPVLDRDHFIVKGMICGF
jgi:hypothetical protein